MVQQSERQKQIAALRRAMLDPRLPDEIKAKYQRAIHNGEASQMVAEIQERQREKAAASSTPTRATSSPSETI